MYPLYISPNQDDTSMEMGSLLNESIENNLQEGANYEEEIEASTGVDCVHFCLETPDLILSKNISKMKGI